MFQNANFFGSCIIHILYTGCAEIKKNNNNSGAKGLTFSFFLIYEGKLEIGGNAVTLEDHLDSVHNVIRVDEAEAKWLNMKHLWVRWEMIYNVIWMA